MNDTITDIHDCDQFKKFQQKYSKSIVLPLVMNTDGAQVFKSSTKSVWLIQAYQCFLRPVKRFIPGNIIVAAAHFGPKKPCMKSLFYPLLKELRKIQEEGGLVIEEGNRKYNLMPVIVGCCCDLPAKAEVQSLTLYSGRFGCGYCLHPGESIKRRENNKAVVRYVSGNYTSRSHENFVETYKKLKPNAALINGIKGISCLVAATDFDLVNGFCLDYMHCVLLDVVKKLLSLWLDSKNHSKPYYIQKKHQVMLSGRVINIKPNSEISRKPRSLFARADFKANEYRSLLLYYLRYALSGLQEAVYVQHFQLLSSAIYILLKESISPDDFDKATLRLNEFVEEFQRLYGKDNVTMNLNLIRHLPTTVRNLGPLWCQSAFGFETNNGVLIKLNTCKRDILHSLAWKYVMEKTVDELVNEGCEVEVQGQRNIRLNPQEMLTFQESGISCPDGRLTIYKSLTIRNKKFSSLLSKGVSTVDYFVLLKNKKICALKFFTITNNTANVLVEMYRIVNELDHFIEIEAAQSNEVITIDDISKKVLYIKIGRREIVTLIPNSFEKTLFIRPYTFLNDIERNNFVH